MEHHRSWNLCGRRGRRAERCNVAQHNLPRGTGQARANFWLDQDQDQDYWRGGMTRGRGEARREQKRGGEKGGEKNICLSSLSWHLHMEAMKILLVGNDFSDYFRARSLEISLFSRLAGGWLDLLATACLRRCFLSYCHCHLGRLWACLLQCCHPLPGLIKPHRLSRVPPGIFVDCRIISGRDRTHKKKHDHVSVYLA